MDKLLQKITDCRVCEPFLTHGCRPIVQASEKSKIIIIGQAPGAIVHNTGIAWDDASGENLRQWMNIDSNTFYDPQKIALVPMGFCYPGKGKSGDLPPRKECAPLWHRSIFKACKELELVVLVGKHAQDYYLKEKAKNTLTETVRSFEEYLPQFFVLPHPSPRNNIWQAKNEWFKKDVTPVLQKSVRKILESSRES